MQGEIRTHRMWLVSHQNDYSLLDIIILALLYDVFVSYVILHTREHLLTV